MDFTYRIYLEREFGSRKGRNPHYSLRAFARDLEMAPSKLSEVFNRKCGLSAGTAKSIARRLRLSDTEVDHFVALVETEHSRSSKTRSAAKEKAEGVRASLGYKEIDLERFKIISGWIHFAILELMDVADFRPEEAWIAKRFDVPLSEVRDAVKRLEEFDFIRRDAHGWKATVGDLATPEHIPSVAKRDYFTQVLKRAMHAIDAVDPRDRDFSSNTLAIDASQMEEARAYLREVRREFARRFQKKASKDRVYSLSIQFFPLDTKASRAPLNAKVVRK